MNRPISGLHEITSLDALWRYTDEMNVTHFPDNPLKTIVGGGQSDQPKAMLVFINPTVRNVSSGESWTGPRYPFLGTKQIWRILTRAGLFDPPLLAHLEQVKVWTPHLAEEVYTAVAQRGLYITNIVKWTGADATLPDAHKTRLFLPILHREIELVQPTRIVTFGLIPFNHLAGVKITLRDYYEQVMAAQQLRAYPYQAGARTVDIIPCYFPVGRGDPQRAVAILKEVAKLCHP